MPALAVQCAWSNREIMSCCTTKGDPAPNLQAGDYSRARFGCVLTRSVPAGTAAPRVLLPGGP